jgi:hypothetical protein
MSLVCSDFALAVFQVVVRTWFSVVMLKRVLLVAGSGVILAFFVFLIVRARAEHPEVLLSEGRRFQIQAVAFGTNHVVGWDDSWLAPSHEPPMIF